MYMYLNKTNQTLVDIKAEAVRVCMDVTQHMSHDIHMFNNFITPIVKIVLKWTFWTTSFFPTSPLQNRSNQALPSIVIALTTESGSIPRV